MARLQSTIAGLALTIGICTVPTGPESRMPASASLARTITAEPAPLDRASGMKPAATEAPLPVRTAAAVKESLPVTRLAVGWIEPTALETVRPRIDGEIVEQWAVEGRMVAAGDPLFRLDDREIRARIRRSEAILERDRAKLAQAAADLARIQELVSRAAASQMQAEQAAADVQILAAEVAASEAALSGDRLTLEHATVKAPIDGRIGSVHVSRGSLVSRSETSGAGLLSITRMHPIAVSFALPERDLGLLRAAANDAGTIARAHISSGDTNELLGAGPISFVDSTVDPGSGTVKVRALLDNQDGALWPGQYVRVSIDFGAPREVVTIPLAALVPTGGGSRVFVAEPDGAASLRDVRLTEIRGEQAVIGEGLRAGEHVVVQGQWRLSDGASVSLDAHRPTTLAERNVDHGVEGQP